MVTLADFFLAYSPVSLPHHLTSYIKNQTPFSTEATVLTTLSSYLALIFSLQAMMRDQKPLKLTSLFQVHNLLLSAGSLFLLILMLEEMLPIVWNHGFFNAICADESWTPRMEFYYMINYYFKYVELLDTVFLALKKKPMTFLHVFHHSATALLCFVQLNAKASGAWTIITLNLAVHVLMYYYYYATAGGARIWWKKYLTMMQISQFIIDIFIVYFAAYIHFAGTYYADTLPYMGAGCSHSDVSALFSSGLITSYLGLFVQFYLQTYKKPVRSSKVATGNNTHKAD